MRENVRYCSFPQELKSSRLTAVRVRNECAMAKDNWGGSLIDRETGRAQR